MRALGAAGLRAAEGIWGCSHCEGPGGAAGLRLLRASGAAATVRGLGRCSDCEVLGLQGAREAAATAKAWRRRGAA